MNRTQSRSYTPALYIAIFCFITSAHLLHPAEEPLDGTDSNSIDSSDDTNYRTWILTCPPIILSASDSDSDSDATFDTEQYRAKCRRRHKAHKAESKRRYKAYEKNKEEEAALFAAMSTFIDNQEESPVAIKRKPQISIRKARQLYTYIDTENIAEIEKIIKSPGVLTFRNADGLTPLEYAARHQKLEIAYMIYEAQFPHEGLPNDILNEPFDPAHNALRLYRCIDRECIAAIEELITSHDALTFRNADGLTPLEYAVRNQKLEIAYMIYEAQFPDKNCPDETLNALLNPARDVPYSQDFLHGAFAVDSEQLASAIEAEDLDITAGGSSATSSWSYPDPRTQWLISLSTSAGVYGPDGSTPPPTITSTAKREFQLTRKEYLKAAPDLLEIWEQQRSSLNIQPPTLQIEYLAHAFQQVHRYPEIPLLLCALIDHDVRDQNGNTALHLAAKHANAQCVNFLATTRKYRLHDLNYSRESALECAVESDSPECVEALLKAGAIISPEMIQLSEQRYNCVLTDPDAYLAEHQKKLKSILSLIKTADASRKATTASLKARERKRSEDAQKQIATRQALLDKDFPPLPKKS